MSDSRGLPWVHPGERRALDQARGRVERNRPALVASGSGGVGRTGRTPLEMLTRVLFKSLDAGALVASGRRFDLLKGRVEKAYARAVGEAHQQQLAARREAYDRFAARHARTASGVRARLTSDFGRPVDERGEPVRPASAPVPAEPTWEAYEVPGGLISFSPPARHLPGISRD